MDNRLRSVNIRLFCIILATQLWSCSLFDDDDNDPTPAKTDSPPSAMDGSFTTDEDTSFNGALNASDADGDKLTYSIITNGSMGTATITDNNLGTFTYTPNPNQFGQDSFTFNASDGNAKSNTATVVMVVNPINDEPVLNLGNDLSGNEGDVLTLASANFNDFDPSDSHTATINWGDGTPEEPAQLSTSANNTDIVGSHVYNDNGIFGIQVCVDDNTVEVCDSIQATLNNLAPQFSNLISEFNHYGYIGNQLVSVNPNTAKVTAIGNPQNLMQGQFWIQSFTYDPMQSKFYGAAFSQTAPPILFSVDHLTGETITVGAVDLPQVALGHIESMAFHPLTGELYANGGVRIGGGQFFGIANRLMIIDPLTAAANQIATVTGTVDGGDADSMVFIADTSYVYDTFAATELYTMDLATGVNTLVAPTTAGCSDMTYAPTRNKILCVSDRTIWELDPITADAIVLGNTHTASEFSGGQFLAIASIPGADLAIAQQEIFQNETFNIVIAFEDVGKADTFSLASVDWLDGTIDPLPVYLNGAGAGYLVASHTYADSGLYNANFCVSDDDGSEGCNVLPVNVLVAPNSIANLVAYYPFNGNALDESVNTNNGTVQGAVLSSDRHGNQNSAYWFDGIDDVIVVADHPSLNPTNQISISAWYKYEAFSSNGDSSIIDKGFTSHTGPTYQYHLGFTDEAYVNASGQSRPGVVGMDISTNGTWNFAFSDNDTLNYTDWNHFVSIYDGTEVRVYVNNALVKTISANGQIDNYQQELVIGGFSNRNTMPIAPGKSNYTNGTIDDIRIYDRALTQAEVTSLFNE